MQNPFPNFHQVTAVPTHAAFTPVGDWSTDEQLKAVLDLIEKELAATAASGPDHLTSVLSVLIDDLVAAAPSNGRGRLNVTYVRFFITVQALCGAISDGRWSLVHDWMLCAISDRPFVHLTAGTQIENEIDPTRPRQFFCDERLWQIGDARSIVLLWISQLSYYSWKRGDLRGFVDHIYNDALVECIMTLALLADSELELGVDAACQLSTWSRKNGQPETEGLVHALEATLRRNECTPSMAKKICLLLSCEVGVFSSRPSAEWARFALDHFSQVMSKHELLQTLVNADSGNSDPKKSFDAIAAAARDLSAEVRLQSHDPATFNYAMARYFDLLEPTIGRLISHGMASECLHLLAIWYGVADRDKRRSPALVYSPTFSDRVTYSTDGRTLSYTRETDPLLRMLTEVTNSALATNLTMTDVDLDQQLHERPGVPDPNAGRQFETALDDFYALSALGRDDNGTPLDTSALLPIHSFQHPIQALTLHTLGRTWPIACSYEEPMPDRPLRKVLFWSVGTNGGPFEAAAVSGLLRRAGVEVIEESGDKTSAGLAEIYCREEFDAIWINAHGEYDSADPHATRLLLSWDRKESITAADLMKLPVPKAGRRLLVLNICDGGNIMVTNAPPRLGVAPLLTSANQAVIAHLWPTKVFVTAVFGALLADALAKGATFFKAFCDATKQLRHDRPSILASLRSASPPQRT